MEQPVWVNAKAIHSESNQLYELVLDDLALRIHQGIIGAFAIYLDRDTAGKSLPPAVTKSSWGQIVELMTGAVVMQHCEAHALVIDIADLKAELNLCMFKDLHFS